MPSIFKILPASAFLFLLLQGCSTGLSQRDLRPEDAHARGYALNAEEARQRGGISGYVPRTCSNGGWGCPAKDCKASPTNDTPVAPVTPTAIIDTDGDGVADAHDHCKDTPKGQTVNAFGCPAGEKANIRLNVEFLPASAQLNSQYVPELDHVAEVMKTNPSLKLAIEGHTDSAGKAKANDALSEQRAQSVVAYLTGKGVDASRLTAKGYGARQPLASNKTVGGRKENRRVSAVVVAE